MDPTWIGGLFLLFSVSTCHADYSFSSICRNICDQSQDKTEAEECKRGCRFYDKFVVDSSEESDEADAQNDCHNSCQLAYAVKEERSTCIGGCDIAKKQYDRSINQEFYGLGLLRLLNTAMDLKSAVVLPHRAAGSEGGHFVTWKVEGPIVKNRSAERKKPARPIVVSADKPNDNGVEKATNSINFYLITLILGSFSLTFTTCYLLVTRQRRWLRRIVTNSTSELADVEENQPPSYDVAIKLGSLPNYSTLMLNDVVDREEEEEEEDIVDGPPER